MNYEKLYFTFIEKFKQQKFPKETYTEKHHIIPRYMNGSDDEINLVRVTFRQHLFLHKLLYKEYTNPEDRCAIVIMSGNEDKRIARLKLAWQKNTERFISKEEREMRSNIMKERLEESDILYNQLLDMNIKANVRKKEISKDLWEFILENAERNDEFLNKKSNKSKYKFVSPEGLEFDSPIFASKYYGNVNYYVIENWCKREQHGWKRILKTENN